MKISKKELILSAISITAVISMLAGTLIPTYAKEDSPALKATEAQEWTALFDRRGEKRTWLGADGIYSVALDGKDAMGSADADTKTFFIFSDTLMGSANSEGKVISPAGMPAQSSALLTGDQPLKDNLSFVYGTRGSMNLGEHLFGEHKWMLDCFVVDGNLYVLGFPEVGWKPKQIDMIKIPLKNGEPDYKKYRKTANIEQLCYWDGDVYLYAYGIGVTMNTESAGAPDPDGYIYIYGYRDAMKEFSRKDLIVSRIKESDFPDFSKLTYWEGDGSWGTDIQKSATVLSAVSCEMSVTPVTTGPYAGKYIAVYTNNTQSSDIMYSVADSPYGPFSEGVKFYHAEEHGQSGASGKGVRYVYNAKAHPHLSKGDLLLVSYNVNVQETDQYTVDYHPRFLYLDLDPEHEYVPPVKEETKEETEENGGGESTENRVQEEKQKSKNPWLIPVIIALPVTLGAAALCFALIRRRKRRL